ncbi:MAG: hypothetical protein K0R21_500 [Anaerocolumna sp.]|jgi:hypothetical protein|nr:hypothetical protein [Anaerocolumna sp.]
MVLGTFFYFTGKFSKLPYEIKKPSRQDAHSRVRYMSALLAALGARMCQGTLLIYEIIFFTFYNISYIISLSDYEV